MRKGQFKTAEGGREPVIMLASDGIATEHKGSMLSGEHNKSPCSGDRVGGG